MRKALVIVLLLALSACAEVTTGLSTAIDFAQKNSRKAMAEAVELECKRSEAERASLLRDINSRVKGSARATAFDCNGDGKPDF